MERLQRKHSSSLGSSALPRRCLSCSWARSEPSWILDLTCCHWSCGVGSSWDLSGARGGTSGGERLRGCSIHLEGAPGLRQLIPKMGNIHPILETLGVLQWGTWCHSTDPAPRSAGRREARPPPGLGCSLARTEGSDSPGSHGMLPAPRSPRGGEAPASDHAFNSPLPLRVRSSANAALGDQSFPGGLGIPGGILLVW